MKINQTLILVLVTLLLCGCVYWAMSERTARKTAEKSLEMAVSGTLITNAKAPLEKKHTDSAGREHSEFNTTNNVNKSQVAVSKPLLDSITKDLNNVKPDDVVSYELIDARIEAKDLKAKVDSLQKQLAFVYSDAFLNLGYIPGNPTNPADHGTFNFGYNFQSKTVNYNKGLKILGLPFGKQQNLTDISSKDPRAKINGYEYLTIASKQPSIVANIQAAANYSFAQNAFRFGPAFQIEAGRLAFQVVAYYNNDPQPFKGSFAGKFNPEINVRYNPF